MPIAMFHRGMLLTVVLLMGCQPAKRYGPVPIARNESLPTPSPQAPAELPAHWSWLAPGATRDIPIRLVSEDSLDWDGLDSFWNHFPPPHAGTRTIHLGQNPLGILAGLILADEMEAISIKVPRGLPDPQDYIPPANPLSYGKWKLGKRLFFDDRLLSLGNATLACASCHRPEWGFSQPTTKGKTNPPSLINSLYNVQQFWDGRVQNLEETIVLSLEDERSDGDVERHVWGGMVKAIGKASARPGEPNYYVLFEQVFGVPSPTQDTIAKALATYMRTILSGDSLIDQAWQDSDTVTAGALLPLLDDKMVERLGEPKRDRKELAAAIARGHRVFERSGCAECHMTPFFSDQDFHNIGVGDSDVFPATGKEKGRFPRAPIGLKEARLIGAYRTPSLRNLPRTAPYFHDGSAAALSDVLDHYDRLIPPQPFLAPQVHDKPLNLTPESREALLLFLKALDGQPVDSLVSGIRSKESPKDKK
jgi:cytochrome c peroxidase